MVEARAVELSMEKYCAVKAALEGSPEMNFSFTILEDKNATDDLGGQLMREIKGGGL